MNIATVNPGAETRRRVILLLQYGLPAAFLVWCGFAFRRDLQLLSWEPLLRSWDIVALAALLSVVNYLLRALRWRYYLGRLRYHIGFRFALLTFVAGFAYTLSPGKIGELARARYYRSHGISLGSVTSAFLAERLMDVTIVVILAAVWSVGSQRYQSIIIAVSITIASVLLLLATLPWAALAQRLRSSRSIPEPIRLRIENACTALAAARVLFRPTALAFGFSIGLVAWGLEAYGLGILSNLFPQIHLDLTAAVGIYGVALLAGGLSMVPGGLGSAEAVMTTLLVSQRFAVSEALMITMACRLVTLWLAVLLGWIAVFLLRQTRQPALAP